MNSTIRTAAFSLGVFAIGLVATAGADHRRGYTRYSVGSYYGGLNNVGGYSNRVGFSSRIAPRYGLYSTYRPVGVYGNNVGFYYNYGYQPTYLQRPYLNTYYGGLRPNPNSLFPKNVSRFRTSTDRRLNGPRFRGRYSRRYYGK